MRFLRGGFRGIDRWCAAVTAAAVLAGCSEDPGLQERVSRLQAEMQEKDRQLQDAQSALEKTRSELKSARAASKPAVAENTPAPSSSPAFLARAQVEDTYSTASKAMQRRMASELKNYTVENCTEFPVVMPSDENPYHSKVVLTFRADSGRSYRLEFPVSADTAGKWNFPTSSDVAGALDDSRSMDSNNTAATTPANTATPANTPRTTQNNATPAASIVPGQTATETRVIDWGDSRKSNGNNRPDRSPTPARANSTPSANATPVPGMQADKDVRIHW